MVWSSSAQGIRPYEREDCPNHIGVSLSRLSPPPLFCSPYRSRVPSGVEGPLVYPVYPACPERRMRRELLGLYRKHSSVDGPLTLVFATDPKNAPVTLLVATLPKTRDLKSCICHTSKNWRGWGGLIVNQTVRPIVCADLNFVPRCLCGHPHAPLWSRWSPVGSPLFSNGKCALSLFSSCRYRSFFFTTRGVHPPTPYHLRSQTGLPRPGRGDSIRRRRSSFFTRHQSPATSHWSPAAVVVKFLSLRTKGS